jgi:hypothetical protein
MASVVSTQQSLSEKLRILADLIEQHGLEFSDWTAVRVFSDEVGISEEDFCKLFRGQTIRGSRDGSWVRVVAEYAGMRFSSSLFRPVGGGSRGDCAESVVV